MGMEIQPEINEEDMVISKMEFKILPAKIKEICGILKSAGTAVKRIRGLEKWIILKTGEDTYMSLGFYRDAGYVNNGIPAVVNMLREITPHVVSISYRHVYDVMMDESFS